MKSHITFDTYITRKKMFIGEQVKIKDEIQNYLTKDLAEYMDEKDKNLLSRLKDTIDENVNWISILLRISQIILTLSF